MTGRRARWRVPEGVRGLTIPGQPSVTLKILCWSCQQAGRGDRVLARFEMDTGDGDGQALWVYPRRVPGNGPALGWSTAVPRVRGTGDAARASLVCGWKAGRGGKSGGGCQHTPDVRLDWVRAQLAEIAAAGQTCRSVLR